ncbi:MAG: hypothetical protein KC800_31950 [Candidatus Eremiobacteraeota bacterium]|nr:hypothetical protein [Candidatus Eremiobacteraeota bacterium]
MAAMLASYWESGATDSPTAERQRVARLFWSEFDRLHAEQTVERGTLWGLVEHYASTRVDCTGSGRRHGDVYRPGIYKDLLPIDLQANIERLWGRQVMSRWPERLVTSLTPHYIFSEALGPALKLWEGISLTAWFVCEGPSSRTDIKGMGTYYRDRLIELEALGCPIDPGLFAELSLAETKLGPEQPIYEDTEDLGLGIILSLGRTRRDGFGKLRDIITKHRRNWMEKHLDSYFRLWIESQLKMVFTFVQKRIVEKGRPPTPKQFADRAKDVANGWFGGRLDLVYAAIGEKSPLGEPEYRALYRPAAREQLILDVYKKLTACPSPEKDEQRHWKLDSLANLAPEVIQLMEATDGNVTAPMIGKYRLEHEGKSIGPDLESAFAIYIRAVTEVLAKSAG